MIATRFLFMLIVFFSFCKINGQVTFVVNEVPENTPEKASIFISGDFEGWTGGQESYRLTKKENTFFISLPKQNGSIDFKFTQGSWETVERGEMGNEINNRTYVFSQKHDSINVKILSWDKSNVIQKRSTTENVFVMSNDFEMPQLNRKRRIWIYLPPNYEASDSSFPVVYMNDGQNIFDRSESYSGEWEVDETLNKLYSEKGLELIVVGIDHGRELRLDEYSPWKNEKYGGGEGDAYLDFIVKTLKPYIDEHYKTLTEKDDTAIIGSSMGGLISHYAGMKYPEIFGKVGVYSPAFWFAPEITEFTKTHGNIKDTRMYFLAGGMEDGNEAFEEINQTVSDMNGIVSILKEQGFPEENIFTKVIPDGKHNEELWRSQFRETIIWLFKE